MDNNRKTSYLENINYTECYVAFLDILGFKTMVQNKTAAEIHRIFEVISRSGMKTMVLGDEYLIDENAIQAKVMSDSVFAYIPKDSKNALLGLMAWCMNFQYLLLVSGETVLLRGAIAEGNLYAKGDITYGPAFVDAYLMEEKKAKMPRIIFKPEITKDITNYQTKIMIDSLTKIDEDGFCFPDYTKLLNDTETITRILGNIVEKLALETGNEKYDSILGKNKYVINLLNRRYKELEDESVTKSRL